MTFMRTEWSINMVNNAIALLVVDLQVNFINEDIFPRTAEVARRVEHELQHRYELVLVTRKRTPPGPLAGDEPELPDLAIAPIDGAHVFEKETLSAATDEVVQLLRQHSIRRVDICGISTEACVMATAFGFYDLGFDVEVLGNYCASNDANREDANRTHNKAIYLLYRNGLSGHWMGQMAR